MHRRSFLTLAAAASLAAVTGCGVAARQGAAAEVGASAAGKEGGFTLTDIAGRTVSFERQPQRVVFGESRHVYSMLFLNKENPLDKVVAWGSDLQRAAADLYDKLVAYRPEAAKLPTIGSIYSNDLTVEALLAHQPDCILFTLDAYQAGQKNGFIAKLDAARLAYVVTDFRLDPVKNTAPSIRLIAQVMDRRPQAETFLDYYRRQVEPVRTKAQGLSDKPTTFLWRAPGVADACSTYTSANLGLVITETGGTNAAVGILPGDEGVVTPEKVLELQPTNVIATGGHWAKITSDKQKTAHVQLGYLSDEAQARESLRALRAQPGFEHLRAFDDQHVFAVYHQFYDSPFNFLAFLAFAKWQHPQDFAELDPTRVWSEFHDTFMPWQATGVFVTGLA